MTDDPEETVPEEEEPFEEAKEAEEDDEELGGDSEEVDTENEVHRPEQDAEVMVPEKDLPSPSTR